MALRPILADRLPLALPHAQPANELWSNQQAQKQRRRHRRSRAEAEIANKVEDSFKFQSLREQIQRSEEHTSELQSLMRISYAVFCLKNKTNYNKPTKQK